jgi:hypothetical protein
MAASVVVGVGCGGENEEEQCDGKQRNPTNPHHRSHPTYWSITTAQHKFTPSPPFQVTTHTESWSVSALEGVKQIFRPGNHIKI